MAKSQSTFFLVGILIVICAIDIDATLEHFAQKNAHVHQFSKDKNLAQAESHVVNKRSTRHQIVKRETGDSTCQLQAREFLQAIKAEDIIDTHTFANETNYSLALVWAGENDGVILVATTEETFGFASPSTLYRSDNFGKSFENINDRISKAIIKKDSGMQKPSTRAATVFIVAISSDSNGLLYRTTDGGANFKEIRIGFQFDEEFVFHPLVKHADKILARSLEKDLYLSVDNGDNWKKIKDNVQNFKWSTMESEPTTIYAVHDKTSIYDIFTFDNELMKTTNLGEGWTTVKSSVYTFGMQGNFLYASIVQENEGERLMEVSTNGGKNWAEAQLPTITQDRFYSILDMTEGIIFMHVDNPGDTGHGILYTSDNTGVIFAESLVNHLYPNYVELTDFYKVQSMRGTYLASQLRDDDQSIHTVISYNRGAEWVTVPRPSGGVCKDESKDCTLQIHNAYSRSRGVVANPPLSVAGAKGIIMVHGHIADSLQTTAPDVYVTSDGGYTWSLALNGPHHYQIADQGGLLVAVPADTDKPNIVKFSTDEGRCWHSYEFTNESVVFTGLLTEPGNLAMSVAIFGYGAEDRQWRTFVVDFELAITRSCGSVDYEEWVPHNAHPNLKGCLLGKKETFKKLKKDSWCKNGRAFEPTTGAPEICMCSRDDYDCDYGYSRPVGSDLCTKDVDFVGPDIDICLRGHEEELVTTGYRKIPGDVCQGGFQPKGDMLIDLKKHCEEGSKDVQEEELGVVDYDAQQEAEQKSRTRSSFLLVAGCLIAVIISLIVIAFLVRKYRVMRKVPNIRYGLLNTEADFGNEIEEALGTNEGLYEDDSDDEESSSRGGGGVFLFGNKQAPPRTSYGGTNSSSSSLTPPQVVVNPQQNPGGKKVKSFHDDSDVYDTVLIDRDSDDDMLE